jgi:hypothetical protein
VAARDAALPDRIGPGHICRCCAAQDMRLRQICPGFRAGIRAFPGGIHLTVADWPVLLARAWSDREIGLDPAEVVPGQSQVRLRPLEHQVEEEALLVTGALQQPPQCSRNPPSPFAGLSTDTLAKDHVSPHVNGLNSG